MLKLSLLNSRFATWAVFVGSAAFVALAIDVGVENPGQVRTGSRPESMPRGRGHAATRFSDGRRRTTSSGSICAARGTSGAGIGLPESS